MHHYCFLLFLSWISQVAPSSRKGVVSPIRNWDPSWAASSARGTTIAVSVNPIDPEKTQAVLVLLLDCQIPNSEEDSRWTDVLGLRVRPDNPSVSDASLRWTVLPWALCCMTGLASDVDYLSRRLLQDSDTHCLLYDSYRPNMSALKIVQSLCSVVREAASIQGGRPYGVQALVIGQQPDSHSSKISPALFTVDPSGGFRHWGTATAIGSTASSIRKQLYQELKNGPPTNAKQALQTALRAVSKTDIWSKTQDLQALLVWSAGRQIRVGVVDPTLVDQARNETLSSLANNKST